MIPPPAMSPPAMSPAAMSPPAMSPPAMSPPAMSLQWPGLRASFPPVVHPELERLLPPLSAVEFAQLEANIVADGKVKVPIDVTVIDGVKCVVDGHHRLRIAHKHGIVCPENEIPFVSLELTKEYMFTHQVGRRNLGKKKTRYVRGRHYLQRHGRNHGRGGVDDQLASDQNDHSDAEGLAKSYGISVMTLRRDAKFALVVDELEQLAPGARETVLDDECVIRSSEIVEARRSDANWVALLRYMVWHSVRLDEARLQCATPPAPTQTVGATQPSNATPVGPAVAEGRGPYAHSVQESTNMTALAHAARAAQMGDWSQPVLGCPPSQPSHATEGTPVLTDSEQRAAFDLLQAAAMGANIREQATKLVSAVRARGALTGAGPSAQHSR
jgi:hypothetical protein